MWTVSSSCKGRARKETDDRWGQQQRWALDALIACRCAGRFVGSVIVIGSVWKESSGGSGIEEGAAAWEQRRLGELRW
ncbi:hypothetical protein M0R45_035771 [Rubus argutus]|uniref:Uncharacterized protein n=1 Tax=Rubus argutus TaxID=59490 RepID=A0AAW1VXV5_RUBAR